MSKSMAAWALCTLAAAWAGAARAESDAEMLSHFRNTLPTNSAKPGVVAPEKAATNAMGIPMFGPGSERESLGAKAAAHVGIIGGCGVTGISAKEVDAIAAVAQAEALLGQPVESTPDSGKALGKLLAASFASKEAAQATLERQQKTRRRAADERRSAEKTRELARKAWGEGKEPALCRQEERAAREFLEKVRSDRTLTKAEVTVEAAAEWAAERAERAKAQGGR